MTNEYKSQWQISKKDALKLIHNSYFFRDILILT